MSDFEKVPGTGGDQYIPYDQRTGNESIVYFTRDLSAEGLKKMVERVNANIRGKVAIKLHTGENAPGNPGGERLDLLPRGHHRQHRHHRAAREGRQVV